MKNMHKAFWIALMTVLAVTAYSQQYDPESDFKIDWDPNVKDGVIITRYIGTKKEVRIPPSIQNYSVTSIGESTFQQCLSLTSVTFQGTIASGNFSSSAFGDSSSRYGDYIGDLREKYLASNGGPGTYRRLANGKEWRKQ